MIFLDANLLIYAYDSSNPNHQAAKAWLEEVFSGEAPVGLPWGSVLAFLRITTHAKIFERPFPITEAVELVSKWLDRPNVVLLDPGPRHWEILRSLLVEGQVAGPLVMDAHLAALAIELDVALHTNDRDFDRFEGFRGLQVRFPLAKGKGAGGTNR